MSNFHSYFVNRVAEMSKLKAYHEDRITKLEDKVLKMESIISNLYIECDPDIEISGGWGEGYYIDRSEINAKLLVGNTNVIVEMEDVDLINHCKLCDTLFVHEKDEHICV